MTPQDNTFRAILFDFMGVILFQREDYLPDPLVDSIDAIIGKVTDDELFKKTVLSNFHLGEMEFQNALKGIAEKYEVYPPLWNIIPELREKYKLGIINNGTYLTYPYFSARFQLAERFDLFLASGQEGARKPDGKIYRSACERLGVQAAQCLFLDDTEENVIGARDVGMRALYWENPDSGFQLLLEALEA